MTTMSDDGDVLVLTVRGEASYTTSSGDEKLTVASALLMAPNSIGCTSV